MRGPKLAQAWAEDQVTRPSQDWRQLCLKFVRTAYGLPAVYPDAGTAWDRAEHKHETTDAASIPAGVPVFWRTPSRFDHVAFSTGGGWCLSTDARRPGRVDRVRIDSITTSWDAQLLGWTEDLNGHRVWRPKVNNNVTAARGHLREARRQVRQAEQRLDLAPEDRAVVHDVAQRLDRVIQSITTKLERLPKT